MQDNLKFSNDEIEKLIEQKQCLAIMGPTASGKSRLSMAVAECLPVEIISVDSALIYKGMDIGTAKPSEEEMQQVPHHLISILEPTESYSAADFVDDVHRLVPEIFARGRIPLLVGGTMMYFNALQKGMAKLPSADEALREKLFAAWQANPKEVHARLAEVDPEAADRIHANDSQRLTRALEVYELTGRPLSELQKAEQGEGLTEFKLAKVALMAEDRAKLHEQIAVRFQHMIDQGFLAEAGCLFQTPAIHPDLPSVRSVGYRQAWPFYRGEYGFQTFVEKGIVATRQLAKRQITWLRKEAVDLVIDPFETSLDQQVAETCGLLKGDL
ncbi:tRNA (adenosine(37)-N6)-dimethylallyltransferase MiaA [Hydrogenovibrio kuenenii]|uniref:tRNA (adenosine(37)-N6)-dimethylallyltransferase MiaA n=1 Tax=Hydrogenovibrio kuenenii TaxID=63658 RepID=UPI0004658C0B|nr:tRNA (adenosine(37)-N6)-dimethylallyltransferase MiaA [Hydrogenovibrio kuenenii]